MRLSSAAPAVVMLALSAIMLVGTRGMDAWDGFTAGPAFFPILIAATATLLSALLLRQAWRGHGEAVAWPRPAILLRLAAVYAALIAFLLLTPVVGMIVMVALLLAFVMIVALRQPPLPSLIAVLVTTGLAHLIFVRWLLLPLPRGILGL